jgi:hypothetical protein
MIGTDSGERWALVTYATAAGVVAVALLVRLIAPGAAAAEGEPA